MIAIRLVVCSTPRKKTVAQVYAWMLLGITAAWTEGETQDGSNTGNRTRITAQGKVWSGRVKANASMG